MAVREPIGRQYGWSDLPDDLMPMESLDHEVAEGQPDLRGYELWGQDNQKLGKIKSLLGSPSTEKAYFALVEAGSLINKKRYLVPLEMLSIDAREKRAYGPFTAAEFD